MGWLLTNILTQGVRKFPTGLSSSGHGEFPADFPCIV
jgi:hypothetical protein